MDVRLFFYFKYIYISIVGLYSSNNDGAEDIVPGNALPALAPPLLLLCCYLLQPLLVRKVFEQSLKDI